MRKRKTHEQFVAELAAVNPNIEVLGEYVNSRTKIEVRCKLEGHKWVAYPNSLLQGHGCLKCADTKKTHRQFVEELEGINPDVLVFGEYINSKSKIKVRCKLDGWQWVARPTSLLKGHGCPKCGGSVKKTHEAFVAELASINPNIAVIGDYFNADTKIKVRCLVDGSEWQATPNKLLIGQGCPSCAKGGYNPSKQGYFYVYAFQNYLGFGITNVPKQRSTTHKTTFKKLNIEAKLIHTLEGDGLYIQQLESHLKQTLPIVNTGVEGFKTEAILYKDRELLFKAIEDFHYPYNSPLQNSEKPLDTCQTIP